MADRDSKGHFLPGNPGGGRPKGSRNKLSEDFLSALYADWKENGEAVIQAVRTEKPADYFKTIASLLPKEFTVNHNVDDELKQMTEEQLVELLARLTGETSQEDRSGDRAQTTH